MSNPLSAQTINVFTAAMGSGGYGVTNEVLGAINGLRSFGAAGGASAPINGQGNLNVQTSASGVNPGATGADNVLAVYSLPANAFDQAGRVVNVSALGSFGATANTKRVKIIANPATAVVGAAVGSGGTTIADTGAVTTSGGGWSLQASIAKYGAAGSNTQIGSNTQAQTGSTSPALLSPAPMTANEAATILIAVTGNATTVVSDIALNQLVVEGCN